jgi:hypothetical protein
MRLGARASRPHRVSAGKMGIEKLTRYTGLAVGLKPAATECEARLRGLERIMYSKTICPRSREKCEHLRKLQSGRATSMSLRVGMPGTVSNNQKRWLTTHSPICWYLLRAVPKPQNA